MTNFADLPKDELREIAAKGGHASHGGHKTHEEVESSESQPGRNPDGTFQQGSKLAKELGHQGGVAAHEHQVEANGRNPDGTFKKGSELAKNLGAQGGHAAHEG